MTSGQEDEWDVVVIGAGPAGEVVAGECVVGGLRTVIVESERVGGECSYWACMPSKALLRAGDALFQARHVPGAREAVTGTFDAAAAFAWRDQLIHHGDDAGQKRWLDGAGVELVRGEGRLTGERTVEVAQQGATRTLTARRAVVVATGSVPRMPEIAGLADVRPWSSREATSASTVPERLIVLGGGAVGCEMAQAFRRLGARQVTVVIRPQRLLEHEEPFAGEALAAAFAAEGITVLGGRMVRSARRDAGGVTVSLDDGREVTGDELLVATGRKPNTARIGLDRIGLEVGAAIAVDDQLRATGISGGWLYAVGDANGRALLTHQGKYQGRVAADAITGRPRSTGGTVAAWADHKAVPRVVFTDPQVSSVGETESGARRAGRQVRMVTYETSWLGGSSVLGVDLTSGKSGLLLERRGADELVVGATFVGQGVGELLHAATIAIVGEVPVSRLWHAVPSFPTVSEVWLRLLEASRS